MSLLLFKWGKQSREGGGETSPCPGCLPRLVPRVICHFALIVLATLSKALDDVRLATEQAAPREASVVSRLPRRGSVGVSPGCRASSGMKPPTLTACPSPSIGDIARKFVTYRSLTRHCILPTRNP